MYDMTPRAVFVSDRVLDGGECEERLARFMETTGASGYEVVPDERIPAMLERPQWRDVEGRAGGRKELFDPVFFFNTFRFDDREADVRRAIAKANVGFDADKIPRYLLGYFHFNWFNSGQDPDDIKPNPEHVCRPCWRLNLSPGCPHRCFYCSLVGFMSVGLNMSEYIENLDRLLEANRWQLTYLVDDLSDVLALEPEMRLLSDLVEYFARKEGRYLIVHTKSANVDFLERLDHRGHTIMCWSLSARTQSSRLEALSGTTEERIEAARKCQGWGYPVRFKFKPIVPVRGWRDEAREMIRTTFARTRPDNLSMTVLMWTEFDELERIVDLDVLDRQFVEAARKAARKPTKFPRMRPFPHEVRKEIYEFYLREIRAIDKDVPLTLSTESLEMWRDLGAKLGVRPDNYTCGCGPRAVPGLKTLAQSPWKVARRNVPGQAADA